MNKKEVFFKLLNAVRGFDEFRDKLYQLKIDILEAAPQFGELEQLLTETLLTNEGAEWYYWYMYERPTLDPEQTQAWNEDGTPIKLDNDEDFWDFLVKQNYLR